MKIFTVLCAALIISNIAQLLDGCHDPSPLNTKDDTPRLSYKGVTPQMIDAAVERHDSLVKMCEKKTKTKRAH